MCIYTLQARLVIKPLHTAIISPGVHMLNHGVGKWGMEGLEEDICNCTQGKKLRQGRQFREDATLHEAIKPTTTQKERHFSKR